MKTLKTLFKKVIIFFRGRECPKCGDWIGDGDDCCQTCGYPWSD